jgi:hypothetical protein
MGSAERGHPAVLPSEAAGGAGCHNRFCMGRYEFDSIARYAKLRFVDGVETVELLQAATSQRQQEEIALVAMLDVHDSVVRDLRLECRHAGNCKTTDCRVRLKAMIGEELSR